MIHASVLLRRAIQADAIFSGVSALLLTFGAVLVAARLLLSFGINAKTPNPWRLAGNALQWGVILAMSGSGAWRVFELYSHH